MPRTLPLLLLFLLTGMNKVYSCIDGTQPECACDTAPILCTPDDLDNFAFAMSSFQHPQDGPTPLCSNAPSSVPNNPTWFAFTAWCTDLTLRASFSGCNSRFGSIGVQIAIYGDCNFGNQVACAVDPSDCNTNDKLLAMNNLVIGQTYYFLVDGCLGSDCTVSIDVVGTCGRAEIAPWTQSIMGNTNVCVGDSETYTAEFLQGATDYHWYIDGTEIAVTQDPTRGITWDTPGTFQLCIDASSNPCVPVTDPPAQNCITVNVTQATAGVISASPSSLCPGEISTITASGYSTGTNNTQVILITDAAGTITDIISGDMATYTTNQCENVQVCSYNYTPGSPVPTIGRNVNSIDCTNNCCDIVCTDIMFEDTQAPTFDNPPADVTLTCFDNVPALTDLGWTDNCDGTGTAVGTESGSANLCNGGSITRSWDYTDQCNNMVSHTQTITVDPTPPPTFQNPPGDITVSCDNVPATAPDLSYTNNGAGGCLISGSVPGVQSGTGNQCGGQISFTWTFTDQCNNTITHTQNVTIDPPAVAAFVNPPADITVTCDNVPTSAPDLNYTNNGTGGCLIAGSVPATQSGGGDQCGGQITYTWTFTDQCNNTITHVQNVTIDPAPAPFFENPPADLNVSCDNIPTGAPDLTYTNNGTGGCLVSGSVPAIQSGSGSQCGGQIIYTWTFTDQCNNTITHVQTITIDPPAAPVFQNPPADITVDCSSIPTGAPDLSYTNNESGTCLVAGTVPAIQSGSGDICGGVITYMWNFTDPCGNTISHTQNVTIDPAPAPIFQNPPADLNVSCDNIPTGAPDLTYTNNAAGACLVSGSVPAVQSGSGSQCGGQIIYTWTFTDQCNNTITHVQTITIDPPAVPVFQNPPASITVDCNNIPTGAPDLSYTNNESGSCLFAGTVPAIQTGSGDICGGTITNTWTFTDPCGNTISHVQTITIDPAPAPTFVNPPPDITVNCDNIPTSAPPLEYTNNGVGACLIAGIVPATPSGSGDICGGTITYTWNFSDQCNNTISHTQNITITPAPAPTFINPPVDITVSCDNIPTGAPPLNYTNNASGACLIAGSVPADVSGPGDICNGVIINRWRFVDQCNNAISHTQTITITPPPPPTFTNLPPDLTVDCSNIPNGAPPLSYTNGASGICRIAGQVAPIISGSTDYCGGTLNYRWLFVDNCGRQIQHLQTITVTPAAPASFLNLPGPITLSCDAVPAVPPDLPYSNSESGQCSINGTVPAIQSGFYDACGGDISYTWVFTDDCGRSISHTQDVTVTPAPSPQFSFFPADLTIGCADPVPPPIDLPFTNGAIGVCEISGTVPAIAVLNGNVTTYTWTLVDPCTNVTFSHSQNITQPPPPSILVNPVSVTICQGESFDLSTIQVTDVNNTGPLLVTYHFGTPPSIGNQYPSPIVSPFNTTFYYIAGTNPLGCSSDAIVEVVVEEPPFAGLNGSGVICFEDATDVNLFDYLNGNPSPLGNWTDPDLTGVDLFNPLNVDLSGLSAGTYNFNYTINSSNACPPSTSSITIELLEEIDLSVATIECTNDPSFYQVLLNSNSGLTFTVNAGTINDLGNNQISITDIPIGTSLTFTVTDPNNSSCSKDISITPPDCDCPTIDPPLNDGDVTVCEGDPVPALSVSVAAGQTANWYDAAAGGTLLLGGSTSYVPGVSNVGVYIFYVEAQDINSGCISSIRTPVELEIVANPVGTNAELQACDNDGDGMALFDLRDAETLITTEPGLIFNYFVSQTDAQNGNNPISNTILSSGSRAFFVSLENQDGCRGVITLNVVVNPPPAISLQPSDESCLGDEDGQVNIVSADGVRFSLDSIVWSNDNVFSDLAPGTYTAYVENANACVSLQSFTMEPGLEIEMASFDLNCNNNGTPSDETDDFYTITFTLNNSSGVAGTYTLDDGSNNLGSFSYGQSQSIDIPAQRQSLSLVFTDDALSCTFTQIIGPLTPCSSECTISLDLLDFSCNDNGTDTDPSDDFYTVTINASAVNGSSNNTYNVLIDGNLNFNFTYGVNSTFDLPADGSSPVISVLDNQDAQCRADQTIGPLTPCSDACLIDFSSVDFSCNNNGTITDPSDDFYTINIVADILNPGPSNRFEVFTNGNSQGLFDYGNTAMVMLPADGNNAVIRIVDADDPSCFAEQTIGPLEACEEDCLIDAIVSNILCNDNGTPTDPSDDTFTFELLVSGQNTGSGWQSLAGGLSGVYNTTETFGPFPIAGGALSFDLQDQATASCQTAISISPPLTCSNDCIIQFDLLDFVCNDNGTLTDPSDDFYTVTVNASAVNGGASASFELFADGNSQGVFFYVNGTSITLPADGSTIEIRIEDADKGCTAQQDIGPLDPCEEDCTISAAVTNILCDDNGTPTDPTDDTFTFDLLVNGQNTGSGWQSTGGAINGDYGSVETFGPFPIAGGALNFELADLTTPTCLASFDVTPPNTCSDECDIRFDLLDFVCNDNGTLTDPSDDFYTVTVNASVINGGASASFELFADGNSQGVFDYASGTSITLPADGSTVEIRIEDADKGCTAQQDIGPLDPCEEDCTISAAVTNILCDDNGTPTDPTDDTFTFDLLVNGQNTGSGWQSTGGAINGDYGSVETFGPFPIAGGALNFELADLTTPTCLASFDVTPPNTCSDECDIRFDLLDFVCNDNGTLTDPSDDFYTVTIDASVINGGASASFELFADGNSQGVFDYANGTSITLPADGSTVEIRIEDADKGCTAQQDIGPLDPCEEDCTISATVTNILCDDNGTPTDPTDDTFTFDLLVNGQNTGSGWQSTGGAINGDYGSVETFGPFPIAGGVLNFELADLTTPTCLASFDVTPPNTCSDECDIRFDLLDFVCNDNGTLTDPSDDFYTITVNASVINGGASASFELFADGNSQGVFDYASGTSITLPADGSTVEIRVEDADKGCTAQQDIGPLDPCEEDCTISAAVTNVLCDDNGTPTDPTDDTFTFDLLVNGQNTGSGWQSTGGAINGDYGSVETFGPFPISGGALNFELADLTTSTCLASFDVTPPNTCSDECDIRFDLLDFVCNDNGTLTDPSDDFYTVTVNASAVNGGASASFELFADGNSQGVFDYASGTSITLPADGSTVEIRIEDADKGCTAQQDIGPLDPCEEDCTISAAVTNVLCDDNGTPTDPTDDTFTFDLLVNGQNTGSGWQSTGGAINGDYGSVETFGPFPISGGALNFELADLTTPTCLTSFDVTPPNTCSDECDIRFDLLDFVCNDNGTLTDPSDDFYTVTINASVINGGASASFELFADGNSQGVFDYASGTSITLPADGRTVEIRIEDADKGCTAQQDIGPLDPCEEDCTISATVTNVLCDDNGTPTDPTDDTFTFDLLVNGQNTGSGWQSTGGAINGDYGSVETFGPFPIGGGALNFELADLTTPTCLTSFDVTPPNTCSDECDIRFDLLDFVCNDNGTLTDPSDDFYTVTVNASVVNGGASASFELFADGNSQGVFDYASGTSITLPADGRTVEIRIEDADKGCTAQQDIGPLDPCEEDCTISATVTNIICDDNGTGDDSSDDTFTFDLLVNGQNTGSGWQSVAGGLTGDYGQVITFGPYPISGGTLNFDLQDLTTTTCQTSIVVDPPMTCSACPQVLTIITPSATVSCKEQMVTLSAASTEAGNYSWTGPNGFTDDNLTTMVSDSGWYFLNATYADGCMAMDSLFVDANTNEPVAAAGPDQYLTCDIEEVLLDGSQSSSGTHIVYSWTDGNGDIVSEEINFLVRTAGTYNLQVIDTLSGCASNIDEVVIGDSTNIPTAFIYADPDNVLDCQVSSILLYSDEQANVQYFWNSVASSEVVISQPGTITLLVVDTITGCENTDQIIITDLQDYPFVNLQPIEPISCYSPSVLIDGSSSQSGPTLVYTWFDNNDNVIVGQTGDTLRVSEAGQYVLQVADTLNGCENYDTVIVESLLDNPPLAVIGQVGALDCNNATQVLDASSSTPFGNLVFSWETNLGSILSGADGPTPEIGSPGLYYLTVLDSISGCIHVDSIEILEDRVFPSIDILPSATITCRLPETTLDASGSDSPNNASIVWTSNPPGGIVSGGNTLTPLINQGGTYTLTLINQDNGCETVELVAVDEDSESPDAVASAEDDLDCITTEIALSGLGSSTGAEFVYAWSGPGVVSGRNTLEPTVNAAGLYELQVENTRNGCTDSDEVSVEENVNVPQDLDVAVTPPPCFGDLGGLEILTVSGGEGPYLYSIDNGQNFFGATEFPALDPGDYTVLVQDAIGCEYEEIFTIPEVPLKVVSVQQEIVVELGQSEQIFANTNIPNAEIDTIIWAPTDGLSCVDCLDPFVTAVDETRYSLTIIDENGCSAEAEILVRVRKERNVYIPNVFSPNGDGVNDVFMIFAGDNLIKSINSFQVFDRWGELIYEDFNFMPNDPTRGWDGRLRGELLNPAVFVYWAEVEFVDGWKELYKGDVTLLR